MSDNVAQVFLADAEWEQALRGIGTALRPGGRLAFEARRPEYQLWQEWILGTRPVSGHNDVQVGQTLLFRRGQILGNPGQQLACAGFDLARRRQRH